MNNRKNSAFTLIELMVVITVILILISLIIPKISSISQKTELIQCTANLKKIGAAFNMYVMEYDGYAPFNPSSTDTLDKFWSWEALYLLGPYLDDSEHEKFYNGTWNVVRCPGNTSKYYTTGTDLYEDKTTYSSNNQNRQAPENWPSDSVVPAAYRKNTTKCSIGRQIVDYQYNINLSGVFSPLSNNTWFTNAPKHSINYKLDFIVKYPSETVVFCDIHYSIVLAYKADGTKYDDTFVYVYPYASGANKYWGLDNEAVPPGVTGKDVYKYIRTNEKVHNGKGINTLFLDGHVEFLTPREVFNYNRPIYDDLMSWGISYPISRPNEAARYDQIPGIHGYRRGPEGGNSTAGGGWCIEHEFNKGLNSIGFDKNNSYSGTNQCFTDGEGRV